MKLIGINSSNYVPKSGNKYVYSLPSSVKLTTNTNSCASTQNVIIGNGMINATSGGNIAIRYDAMDDLQNGTCFQGCIPNRHDNIRRSDKLGAIPVFHCPLTCQH